MFTGVVDEDGQKCVKELGGELVDSIHNCTHLVTDKVRRTVKFLCGVARGLLIVTPEWLERSRDARTFIDASPFLVKDQENEKKYKFKLVTAIDKAAERRLLSGYKIHVTKSVKPDPEQMKDIISCSGGQSLATIPKKKEINVVVVSCTEDEIMCQPAIKVGIPIVSAEFLLTGILQQHLNIEAYGLFSASTRNPASKRNTRATESMPATKRRKR